MKKYLILLLLYPLLISGNAHKFYVSVTQIEYSSKSQSLQIISRIFTDDLERTLTKQFAIEPHLQSEKENPKIDEYLAAYYQNHLKIKINGQPLKMNYLGKEYDVDVTKSYVEMPINTKNLENIEIKNSLLLGVFPNQKNIIHLKINHLKKNFALTEEEKSIIISLKN